MKQIILFFSLFLLLTFSISNAASRTTETIGKIVADRMPDGIGLKWDDPSGYQKVVVVRNTDHLPKDQNDGQTIYQGNGKNYTDKNIEPGHTYYYTVIFVSQQKKTYTSKAKDTVVNLIQLQNKIPEPAKVGVVTASAGTQLMWIFTFFDSFKDFWFAILRAAQALLIFLGLRAKKGENWGVVYDWDTKEPLKNIVLDLANERGENMGAMITDESGRFGFLVDEGKYFLKVQASKDYEFKPENYDLEDLYGKVYKGEELFIKNEILLKLNVPLVSKIPVENRKLKLSWLNFTKIKSSKIVNALLEISFWAGFIFVTLPLFNGVTKLRLSIFLFYLFMLLIRVYLLYVIRQWGLVIFEENRNPIPFAVIRAFKKSESGPEQMGITVSNTKGGFYMLVPPDTYDLSIKGRSIEGQNFSKEMTIKTHKGMINGVYQV